MAEGSGSGSGGGPSGGGYSRTPKYQNKFAFKHNPHSRLTLKIGAIPATAGCCARCAAQIEWKRTYRKYRALTKPRKCTGCSLPKVKLAYHVLCAACAEARGRVCPKCLKSRAEADLEQGTVRFWRNGALLGTAFQGLTRGLCLVPAVCLGSNNSGKLSAATLVEFDLSWLGVPRAA